MFLGHLALGFASKRALPRESLPVLLAAPLFLDLLWPLFLATGLESVHIDPGNTAVTPLDLHDFPYSHSLLMAVVWSVLFGLAFFALRRDARTGVILGGSVFSHWLLDFLAHAPDLPLYPGSSTYVGLGLWNSVAGTLLVEGTLFAVGVALYVTATRPKTRAGTWLLGSLVVVLTGIYLGSVFGPPPPNATAIIISDLAVLVFLAWAYAADKRRVMF
jgi:membrane-bound metal-dependent hydrolase YbcI (DUF457 family)